VHRRGRQRRPSRPHGERRARRDGERPSRPPHGEAAGRVTDHVEVRRGTYHDSVALMVVSRTAGDVEGVEAALVAMATELNLSLLADLGFNAAAFAGAGANDLVLAFRAADGAALEAARAAADAALASARKPAGGGGFGEAAPARTLGAAARRGDASLALVSVPGEHAFVEAMDALRSGLSVMVFSDNVPVEQEVALKAEAERRGLLVMGPDCGTAVVGGVGLGFANVVRPGPVGIVAASGTGAQQLCCLLDAADVGVRHVLGVGGRDLSAAVGGASTLLALEALDADPATAVIVLVSKPPDEAVADRVRQAAEACATPVVLGFVGPRGRDLTATAAEVAGLLGRPAPEPRWWPAPEERTGRYPFLRGLFAGGTLCDEAMTIAAAELGPIASNIPLEPSWALPDDLAASGHAMIDFGDDALTRGRPHPMIDHRLRLDRIAAEARDPSAGVLLLDVVLGHGAHPDPAEELAPALSGALRTARDAGGDLTAVVSLCGTRDDPQGLHRQAEAFRDAGASVHLSNAAAARKAVELFDRSG